MRFGASNDAVSESDSDFPSLSNSNIKPEFPSFRFFPAQISVTFFLAFSIFTFISNFLAPSFSCCAQKQDRSLKMEDMDDEMIDEVPQVRSFISHATFSS